MGGRGNSDLAKSLRIEPEEDSGSETASRYNFQFQCAARHCFAMLNNPQLSEIVCEWHVDYALIYRDGTGELISVKHREPHLGPWPFAELWGKGGLSKLHKRWMATPEAKCRLVTNGPLKSGRDTARDFSNALSEQRVDKFVDDAAQRLGCSTEEAEAFLLRLRIEHGIPDRVTLRAHAIINIVEGSLAQAEIADTSASEAWDAVVRLVSLKSRDLDNRDFSSIDLASPRALDAETLTSAKVARRTITRSDVVEAISSAGRHTSERPLISNMWVREPVANFVGREKTLQAISDFLESQSTSQTALALVGMSGVGKSEILSQYAWKNSSKHEFVWWVRADSWNSMISDFTSLAEEVHLPAPDSDDGVRQLKEFFLNNRGLILLDGAPADPKVCNFIPKRSATRFLIASLDQRWATHATMISVAPLIDADAQLLLAGLLTDTPQGGLSVLNKALNGLPLALKQAAGYITTSGISVEVYSGMVHDRATDLLRRSAPPEHVGLTAALSITIERLQADHPLGLDLLSMLSHLAPGRFPTTLFAVKLPAHRKALQEDGAPVHVSAEAEELASLELQAISQEASDLLGKLEDQLHLFDALADLQKFSLVDMQEGGVYCHALTQAVVRRSLTEPQERAAIEGCVVLLNKVTRLSPSDSRYWPHYRETMPHFESLLDYLDVHPTLPANTLMFYAAIAMNLGVQGAKESSLSYAKKAVSVSDRLESFGAEIPVFARTILIEALIGTDRWDEALGITDETLAAASDGPLDALSRATLHAKRASILHLQGRLEESMLEFDTVHRYIDSSGDIEDSLSMIAAVRANKANLRREVGDARGAIVEFKQMISDYASTSARNGLATLYSNLSLSHLEAAQFAEALAAALQALEISHESFNGLHGDAARDWNNAGLALLELGRPKEAAEAFQASLNIHERLNERKSSLKLIVTVNLGRAQLAEGDANAARATLEGALADQEIIVGPNHREVAATLINLSATYTALHLFGNAAAAAHRAIKIDVQVYGENHPELAPDYHNMASALLFSENYRAARKWLHKAHLISIEHFGAESIHAGMCLSKMAICEYATGRRDKGLELIREAISIFDPQLESQHPERRSSQSIMNGMLQGVRPVQLLFSVTM
ncbi:dsDNA nuclease domain-containing protein [Streptomyces sp. NPDC089922]|uniref:dsDNA nuclease domain-containing protein n=1 Tax=Streptomyces sp. NPDC089922 TaxID=3155189 RepID=UPI0034222DFF